MAVESELWTFLRRTKEGAYRLEAEDGALLVRGRTYREVRDELELVLSRMPDRPGRVKIFIGASPARMPARRSPSGSFLAIAPLSSIA
jgi:hypothetical protein